jgi:transcriptional regulator GlxA family with amidase domain
MGQEECGSVVVLAYDGIAADEAGIVIEILGLAGLPVLIASIEAAAVTSYHGRVLPTRSTHSLAGSRALVVPGGMGVQRASHHRPLLGAIATLADSSTWVCATSTGTVLLAAAGVLGNARVTTHWLASGLLRESEVRVLHDSYVEHGRFLTASGAASSARLGFRLVGALAGTEAEERVRDVYRPAPRRDRRLDRPDPWWRQVGRKRAEAVVGHSLDPHRVAEVVVLDLDD